MLQLIGFFFILTIGTLAHFIYDWSNHNKIVALFVAVNESTWEHIKLVLGPTFIWILIEIPFLKNNPNFLFASFISLVIPIIFIPLFFYVYKFILKKDVFFLDILDFVLAILFSQVFNYIAINSSPISNLGNIICLIFILIIFIIYLLFTYLPPNIFLFVDPINKKKGIKAHN